MSMQWARPGTAVVLCRFFVVLSSNMGARNIRQGALSRDLAFRHTRTL